MDLVPLDTSPTRPLIGRASELDELVETCSASRRARRAGSGRLLSGDAGVGKSRILAELTGVALRASWRVLTGHCLDFGDSALPYLPFSELFGRLAADAPGGSRGDRVRAPCRPPPDADDPAQPRCRSGAGGRGRPRRPVRGRPRRPGAPRPLPAGAARRRGRALGRPVDPRDAELPVRPTIHPAGVADRVLPQRRPAPPAPAADLGRRVVAAARRSSGSPSTR